MRRRERVSLSFASWPTLDRQLWEAAHMRGDFLEADGAAARWRDKTRHQVIKGYGLWLFHLAATTGLDPNALPHTRVTAPALCAFVESFASRALSSVTVLSRVTDLSQAIRVMEPDADRGLLLQTLKRLRARARPRRNKQSRIRHPRILFATALCQMDRAEQLHDVTGTVRSARYRDGLLMAFLATAPIRLQNLSDLVLGQHFVRTGDVFRIVLAAPETKEARPYAIELPAALTPYIERYLEEHRCRLLRGHANRRLWISIRGRSMKPQTIYWCISRLTERLFGERLTPHLFRDCLATGIATFTPDKIRVAARLLGHTSLKTTERAYNQAEMLTAVRQYHASLAAYMHDSTETLEANR